MSDLTPVMQETLDAIRSIMAPGTRRAVSPWEIAHHLYEHIPAKNRRDLRDYEPMIRKRLYVLRDLGLVEQPWKYSGSGRSFWRPVGWFQ